VLANRDDILTVPMSHYVDGMMTRLCHGYNELVCDDGLTTDCLPVADALAIVNAGASRLVADSPGPACEWSHGCYVIPGDVEFLDRFTRPYSRILMYPAFRDMVDAMMDAVEGKTPLKLQIVASHDTVISPMLAVLGVSDGRYCVVVPVSGSATLQLWFLSSVLDCSGGHHTHHD
jgi:hypothetical protein